MGAAPSFAELVESEGLGFGLPVEALSHIQQRTQAGDDLRTLLDDPELAAGGLTAGHLMRLRRAVCRHTELARFCAASPGEAPLRNRLQAHARRWAWHLAPDDAHRRSGLERALASAAAACAKRGRVRIHARRLHDPRLADLIDLVEHSLGCDEFPPHRWFQLSRALADGLVIIEVISLDGEAERALGDLASADLVEALERALARPVLDGIAERAERRVIASAASALTSLLSRAPVAGRIAGVLAEHKRIHARVEGGEADSAQQAFDTREADRLAVWLQEQGAVLVGLARVGGRSAASDLIRLLIDLGLTVEPVREVGLMKQARALGGPIKFAAASIVCRRLADPLAGYADLEPDELGLGEYLNMVAGERLLPALTDARQAAELARKQGGALSASLARGVAANPMVRRFADLRPGLELSGTVVNLTHFGAFIELGLEQQGLVHLSQLSEEFIEHPSQVVQVGQTVRVRVVEVDETRGRIGLSMRPAAPAGRARQRNNRPESLKALDDLFKK